MHVHASTCSTLVIVTAVNYAQIRNGQVCSYLRITRTADGYYCALLSVAGEQVRACSPLACSCPGMESDRRLLHRVISDSFGGNSAGLGEVIPVCRFVLLVLLLPWCNAHLYRYGSLPISKNS